MEIIYKVTGAQKLKPVASPLELRILSGNMAICSDRIRNLESGVRCFVNATGRMLSVFGMSGACDVGKATERYRGILMQSVLDALNMADRIIEEYGITDEEDIKYLRKNIVGLLDEADKALNPSDNG